MQVKKQKQFETITSIPPSTTLYILLQNTERMSLCDLDPPFCKVNFTGFVVQRIIPLQKTMNRKPLIMMYY